MPELGIAKTEFSRHITGILGQESFVGIATTPKAEFVSLAHSCGEEYLDRGGTSYALVARNPERVKAISFRGLTPDQAKAQYYLQRIFSTVFPDHFPHFYAGIGSDGKGNLTGTIRERIYPDTVKKGIPGSLMSWITKRRFSSVRKTCERWGIPLDFDWKKDNLSTNSRGKEYYLDALAYGWNDQTNYKDFYETLPRILDYMRVKRFTSGQIAVVEKSLARLTVLGLLEDSKPAASVREKAQVSLAFP